MIKFDSSDSSVIVTCTECPYWFSFRFDKPEAYRSAAAHRVLVHDVEPARAAEPGRLYAARRAHAYATRHAAVG